MSKSKELVQKEKVVQAVLVADTFGDEFVPISESMPHALLPLLNKPLLDYTLEFLSLGGIEETFLFCCSYVEAIKEHINNSIKTGQGWTITMKVNVIVSESCHSFGDCLRDLDAKGVIRGDFVLLGPGVVSNISLLQLLKKHGDTVKSDKDAVMTAIFQESGIGYIGRCPHEDVLLAINSQNRMLFHKKFGRNKERKIEFPLDIFLENPSVSLLYNLKDTHVAICSPAVLPLFSDNFDFQTKDDFIRGLLMNEEIMGSTVYIHVLKGSQFGGAVTNWRMYQALSHELKNRWIHPICPDIKRNRILKNDVVIGNHAKVDSSSHLYKVILGENVIIEKNVRIENAIIFSNTKIEQNCTITHCIIGSNCTVKAKSVIGAGSILGNGTVIEKNTLVENSLVQAQKPENFQEGDQLGNRAYRIRISEDAEDDCIYGITRRLSHLHLSENELSESDSEGFSDSNDEGLSHTHSPAPDDTKLFYTEVIDSLTRGYDDKLSCDNLILEINSSRYAYNITVKEVNFNVVKAILNMSLRRSTESQYFSYLSGLLVYFSPILKNYLRNESAMTDSLQAIEDVAESNDDLKEKWVMFVLKYLYDKDFVTEDVILNWFATLDSKSKFHGQVKPFTDWLQEAEEESSEEDE